MENINVEVLRVLKVRFEDLEGYLKNEVYTSDNIYCNKSRIKQNILVNDLFVSLDFTEDCIEGLNIYEYTLQGNYNSFDDLDLFTKSLTWDIYLVDAKKFIFDDVKISELKKTWFCNL